MIDKLSWINHVPFNDPPPIEDMTSFPLMDSTWKGLDRDIKPGYVPNYPVPDVVIIGGVISERVSESLRAYLQTDEGRDWAKNPQFQIVNAVPSPDREIIALRKKVAELEERLKKIEDGAI